MRYKKIMVLAILLVSLLAVSAVSAADNATSDIVGVENQEDTVIAEINDDLTLNIDDNILSSNPKTFTDLNTLINDNEDSDVYLDSNYTFELGTDSDFTEGINIARAVTVHGNGYTIDGDNAARIFTVSNSNIVFRDVVFVNGYSAYDGGAIYGDCSAVNCTFKDNHAGWGGAIAYGSALNCIFIGNSALVGGAMYGGSSSAVNCTFVNNSVDRDGGAIAYGSAVNCTFVGNSANYGGAICAYRDECAVNCTFINNTARYGGGIYFTDGDCTLINLIFEGNSAQQGVDFYSEDFINLVNVTVDKMSTAIVAPDLTMRYGNSSKLIITLRNLNNNNFVANSQIYVLLNNNEYTVTTDSKGQASLDMPTNLAVGEYEATISYKGNSNYYSASTTCWVSVDKMQTHISPIHNAENMELSATLTTIEGKTIGGANVIINLNGKEYTLKTDSKGQVKISTSDLKSGRHTANITYKGNGKYLPSNILINIYVNDDVSVGTFIDLANEINNAGSQLKLTRDYAYDPSCDSYYQNGVTIEKSIVIDGNGYTINGNNQARAFSVDAYDVILNNINFVNCSVENSPEEFGGAIYWDGDNGALSGCSFVNCSVYSSSYDAFSYSYGGAVFWSGVNGSLSECIFENCYSSAISISSSFYYYASYSYGGAVYWDGYEGSLLNCDFVNCYSFSSSKTTSSTKSSYGYGGAVSWMRGAGTLMNCNFVNCASNRDGGAVFWSSYDGYLSNCSFIDCSCEYDGGAVSWYGEDGILNYCNFIDCQAYNSVYANCGSGGAVYWYGDNGNLSDSIFVNCHSRYYGGAAYWSGADGILKDSLFVNCYMRNPYFSCYGGAAYWTGDNGIIKECTFQNSSSGYDDVYTEGENITVIPGKIIPILYVDNINYYSYGTGELVATLTSGETGNAIGNAKVIVNLDGVNYSLKTDSNGQVKVSTSALAPGTYMAAISYAGNSNYKSSSATSKVIIKSSICISSEDLSVGYNDGSKLTVTLTDSYTGSAIGSVNVVININGKDYTVKTNSKGQAKLTIPSLNPGTYTANISFAGNSEYDPSSTTVNVVVNKADTSISAIANSTELVVTLTHSVTGKAIGGAKIVVNVNGSDYSLKTDSNGQAKLSTDLSSYTAIISYAGNAKYNPSSATVNFNTKTDMVISAVYDDVNKEIVATLTNNATGNPVASANVNVNLNGETTTVKSNGKGNVIISTADLTSGTYTATISYPGNAKYNPASTSIDFTIKKDMVISAVYDAANNEIVATLTNNETGNPISSVNVNVNLNGETTVVKSNGKGKVVISTADLASGTYTAIISYPGNAKYNPASTSISFNIKTDVIISAFYDTVNSELVATLTNNATGNPISGANVKVNINNVTNTVKSNSKGQVIVSTADLPLGNYAAFISYAGNSKYYPANATVTFTVKLNANIAAPDVNVVYRDESGELVATLTNDAGKALNSANIIVNLNGVDYALKTNSKGQVKVSTSGLAPGTYTATISYAGNSKYYPTVVTANVVVNKAATSISAIDNGEELVATLTNEYGSALNGANVKVSLNGVEYTLKTNSKGQVKISTADLNPKAYTATVSYAGNAKYNSAATTIKVAEGKATTSISTVYNKETGELITTLTNADTGIGIKGAKVVVNVNGVKNSLTADSNGQVKISTEGLDPNTYVIASSYAGNTKYTATSTTETIFITN